MRASLAQSFTSNTSNWYGTLVSKVSGSGAATLQGEYEWDFNFMINQDNSIQGSAKGKGSVGAQTTWGAGTGDASGAVRVTGYYDPTSGNISLFLDLNDLLGAESVTTPRGSGSGEMTWIPSALQLVTPGQTFVRPSSDNSWTAPPVPKKDGGTATKTVTYPGIEVTLLITVYQSIAINRLDRSDDSFVTSKTPEFSVNVRQPGYDQNSANWQVAADSQYAGPPSPADATGASSFTFQPQTPSNNPTGCSRTANEPLKYKLQVKVSDLVATSELTQDEADIIRQEYIDAHAARTPGRSELVAPSNALFNQGNYGLIMDNGLQSHLDRIAQQLATLAPQVTFQVTIGGGYRNPRKNACVSHFPTTSYHVWGSALDLAPSPFNAQNLDSLRQAGADTNARRSICEVEGGAHGVPCNTPGVNHVHVDWAHP